MFRPVLFASLATACLASLAPAYGSGYPGSLLVYPEYNNSPGTITFLTVTNTSDSDPIDAHFAYIDGATCDEISVVETLAANDTLTLLSSVHSGSSSRGFVFLTAEDTVSGERILHNYLIGASRFLDGFSGSQYTLRPFVFQGIDPGDNDGNGLADLDGMEYEEAPAEFLIPNFLGYRPSSFSSEVILIGLTGGGAFDTRADIKIYNDNASEFTASYTFKCWEKVPATAISPAFRTGFLTSSGDDPLETLGAPAVETGWFRVTGGVATSSTTTYADPVILVAFIEHVRDSVASSQPFAIGVNDNGSLWATSLDGTH